MRRLNEKEKKLRVKNLLRDWKADIVCLQEAKLKFVSRAIVCSLWGHHHIDWCYLGSRGASGRIVLVWDRRVVEKVEECVGAFSIDCSFRSVEDNFEWDFACVYRPNDDHDKKMLWDELAKLISWWDLSWCIGGDLNIIRYPSERSSDTHLSPAMLEFSKFIWASRVSLL